MRGICPRPVSAVTMSLLVQENSRHKFCLVNGLWISPHYDDTLQAPPLGSWVPKNKPVKLFTGPRRFAPHFSLAAPSASPIALQSYIPIHPLLPCTSTHTLYFLLYPHIQPSLHASTLFSATYSSSSSAYILYYYSIVCS